MFQQAYLVRLVGTRDLVGIFVACSVENLFWLVDECIEPDACEFAEMHDGGIYWDGPAKPIPLPNKDEDFESGAADMPWSTATTTWGWHDQLHGRNRWTAFDPEEAVKIKAELKAKPNKAKRPKKSAQIIQLSEARAAALVKTSSDQSTGE